MTPSPAPRKRIPRACDQCHKTRVKCDGSRPCQRCLGDQVSCSYDRECRRNGRPSRSRRAPRPLDLNRGPLRSAGHDAIVLDEGTIGIHRGPVTQPESAYPLWAFQDGDEFCRNEFNTSGGDWFNNLWLQDFNDTALAPLDAPTAVPTGDFPVSSFEAEPSNNVSAQSSTYPVLEPLMPYLKRIMSPALSCHLLESYVVDAANGIGLPASPLLLTHIFRREALLSTETPRRCSLPLLASVLLVSASTTEFPFFGGSPSYRTRLYQQLLHLTLRLLDHRPLPAEGLGEQGDDAELTSLVGGRRLSIGSSSRKVSRAASANVDEVIAYMHVGLVIMLMESKPAGSHWWQIAFRKAKECRLNSNTESAIRPSQPVDRGEAAITTRNGSEAHHGSISDSRNHDTESASPLSVNNDTIVESGGPTLPGAQLEELRVRQRVWWTLYIWDKHLALRYNQPPSITDAECQQVGFPAPSEQAGDIPGPNGAQQDFSAQVHIGIPRVPRSLGIFDLLVPLMSTLGLIMNMHHAADPSWTDGTGMTVNPIREAYASTVATRLNDLERSVAALSFKEPKEASSTTMSARQQRDHQGLMVAFAQYLIQLMHCLIRHPIDKLSLLSYLRTAQADLPSLTHHSAAAVSSLRDILALDHDLGFKAMFFSLFHYHGSTLPWAMASEGKQSASKDIVAACQTYVRAYEIANTTYQAEYLRKARRLLLQAIKESQSGTPLSTAERHLRDRILHLYRWTGNGIGLGL